MVLRFGVTLMLLTAFASSLTQPRRLPTVPSHAALWRGAVGEQRLRRTGSRGREPTLSLRNRLIAPLLITPLLIAPPLAAQADDLRGFVLAPPRRDGLQNKWLEQLRVVLQDEADAQQYGGELAPGGPPATSPTLLLIPIVQMQQTLRSLTAQLDDTNCWASTIVRLQTGPFEPTEFKRVFNAFSDNIYYVSGSSEANAYLLGGATPSTQQTTQYLLRNEALKQIGELVDELKYQQGIPAERREPEVLTEYANAALKAFDDYLKLAPSDQRKQANDALGIAS